MNNKEKISIGDIVQFNKIVKGQRQGVEKELYKVVGDFREFKNQVCSFGFTYNFFICTIITCMLLVTIVSDFMYYYISDRVLVIGSLALLAVNYYFLTVAYTAKYIPL